MGLDGSKFHTVRTKVEAGKLKAVGKEWWMIQCKTRYSRMTH